MEREEAEAIYDAGREAVVEALVGFSAVVEQVAALEAEVEELKRQVGRDSRNSSMPPSSDPPKSRAERRRAAREAYKRSLRSSGGQPGHEGRSREMAAPEQVDRRFDHIPPDCACGHRFDQTEERLGDPLVHQQWELPPISPLVYEHRLHRLLCPGCAGGRDRRAARRGLGLGLRAAPSGPTSRSSPGSIASRAARSPTSCARSSASRSRSGRSIGRSCG